MSTKVEYSNIYFKPIQEVRKLRLSDQKKEYERICERVLKLFPRETIKPLEQHLHYMESLNGSFDQRQAVILLGHALETKRVCEKTHFVFIHGQSSSGIVVIYLLQKLAKKILSKKLQFFKYLREPDFNSDLKIEDISKLNVMIDFQKTAELLSVDSYFFHTTYTESAMDFLCRNENSHYSFFDQIDRISPILKKLGVEEKKVEAKAFKLAQLAEKIQKTYNIGSLVLVCIPKDKVREIAYRAHPGGKYCHCQAKGKDLEVLERLNQGVLCKEDKCEEDEDTGFNRDVPQYRLLTAGLKPENGVLIFIQSPFSRDEKKAIKKQIDEILQEL